MFVSRWREAGQRKTACGGTTLCLSILLTPLPVIQPVKQRTGRSLVSRFLRRHQRSWNTSRQNRAVLTLSCLMGDRRVVMMLLLIDRLDLQYVNQRRIASRHDVMFRGDADTRARKHQTGGTHVRPRNRSAGYMPAVLSV